MIEIGKFNQLKIIKLNTEEVVLDGGESGEILLQSADLSKDLNIADELNVFVYGDTKAGLKATTQIPLAQLDDVAYLKVVSISRVGAFLDWGLTKDLLLPYSEQSVKLVEGQSYVVKIFLDEDNRLTSSMMLNDFIQETAFYLKEGQKVDLIIAEETDLGLKAIINNEYWGVLYKNEIFQKLTIGQKITGYIKKVRDDKKIDLVLQVAKYGEKVESVTKQILAQIESQGGTLSINDKSPPDEIYQAFSVSKKVFKQAIGTLYKQHLIVIDKQGISLVSSKKPSGK